MISRDLILAMSFTLAFISLVALIFTDKKIIFGIIAVGLLIYFYSSNLENKTANLMTILTFISGILLMTLELFIPSFGIIGVAGGGLTVYSLFDSFDNNEFSLIVLCTTAAAVFISVTIFVKLGFRANIFNKSILVDTQSKQRGYNSKKDYSFLLGKNAVTKTVLRPTGVIIVDGSFYDAKTNSEFISRDKEVVVKNVRDGYIIVEEMKEEL